MAERPALIGPHTLPIGRGSSSPSDKRDEPKARAVHFEAQEEHSDSDSAMLESPASEHVNSEPNVQSI
jgi:hypothetical protein